MHCVKSIVNIQINTTIWNGRCLDISVLSNKILYNKCIATNKIKPVDINIWNLYSTHFTLYIYSYIVSFFLNIVLPYFVGELANAIRQKRNL